MTKWYSKNLIHCHCFSFWRHNVYQPSLDKYNFCPCRTITGLFSTLKIARACFCCVCLISLTAMSKHRSWGGASIYIYITLIDGNRASDVKDSLTVSVTSKLLPPLRLPLRLWGVWLRRARCQGDPQFDGSSNRAMKQTWDRHPSCTKR